MSENPYQAPLVTESASNDAGANPNLDSAVNMLRQTKPWVRFISVMMCIGSVFMILGGIFMMVFGGAGALGAGGQGAGAVIGIVYIAMALFYIVPAIFLWRYADRIALFMQEKSTVTLSSALEAQKSFWKFVGILTLVFIVIYALAIVVGTVAAIATSAR